VNVTIDDLVNIGNTVYTPQIEYLL